MRSSTVSHVGSQPDSSNASAESASVESLQAAVQDARTIFDHLQEAIFIHNADCKVVDVNQQALELFQITREEALCYSVDSYRMSCYDVDDSGEVVVPSADVCIGQKREAKESLDPLFSALWQSVLQGERITISFPSERPCDNRPLHLEVTFQKLILSNQVRVMACVRDVTEHKRAEVEQQRLLSIIEATPDLVGMSDLRGKCIYLNSAGRKIIGLAEEEPINFHIDETMSHEARQRFVDTALPQALAHGSYVCESGLVTRAGEELPVSRVLIAHRNEAGEVDCLSAVMRDIRALKTVEAQLRDREQFLSSIYEGVNIAIFAWDLAEGSTNELRCSGWNPTCEAATGISAESAIGQTPDDLFGPAQGAAVLANNLRCISQNQSLSYEEKIVIEGSPTWWHTKLNPIENSQGQVYRVIGTTTNITELKLNTLELEDYSQRQAAQAEQLTETLTELRRTQAQIIQSEKMSSLGEMVAGIAHEINNPVNFIHANVQPASNYAGDLISLIRRYQTEHTQPSDALKEMLEDIDFEFIQQDFLSLLGSMKAGTQRIREIVLSLRNFSRLDEAEVKAVDIQEGIDNTLVILSHKLRENAAKVPIEVIKDYSLMPLVECYPSQLNQVVLNIVANAIDAFSEADWSAAQPKITITTLATEETAQITIADNGPGMPEPAREKVFNPFYTTKPIGKGIGMGLSISYQIVTEKHGGHLSVASAPGGGTAFTIEIPLKQTLLGRNGSL